MVNKSKAFALVAAGLTLGAAQAADKKAPAAKGGAKASTEVKCYGANKCKGNGMCAITAEEVAATVEKFGEKFKATEIHSCKGHNKCGGDSGQLNWIHTKTEEECFGKKGFVFEKDAEGKLKVKMAAK